MKDNTMKNILKTILFLSSISYAEVVKFIPPEIKQVDTSVQKKLPEAMPKYDKYIIDTKKLWEQYDKWNEINTGTYTYLCLTNTNGGIYRLLFIKNKKIVKSLQLSKRKKWNLDIENIEDFNKTSNILTKRKRFYYNAKGIGFYLLSKRFYQLSAGFPEDYDYFDIDIEYSQKYNYVSHMSVTHRGVPIEYATDISPIIMNSYGLLTLPRDIEFTDNVVKKIFKKYEQAWECEEQILASKEKSDRNLTLLEKAVGKERLECLDKHLMWDE